MNLCKAFRQLRGFKKKDTARVEFIQSNRKRKWFGHFNKAGFVKIERLQRCYVISARND